MEPWPHCIRNIPVCIRSPGTAVNLVAGRVAIGVQPKEYGDHGNVSKFRQTLITPFINVQTNQIHPRKGIHHLRILDGQTGRRYTAGVSP